MTACGGSRFDGPGQELLTAAIVGFETGPRIGYALGGTEILSRGWHSGPIFGGIAAAPAGGKLRGLDGEQLEAAGLITLGVLLAVSRRSLASTRRALERERRERERRRDEKQRRTRKPMGVAPLAVKTVMHTAEPVDAVRCCVAVQRALRRNLDRWGGIRVRMGAHVGTSVRRGEDLFGLDVVIASRVADLADGAQILVTEAVRESVRDYDDLSFTGPDDLELRGLPGTHTVYGVNYLPGP